MATLSLSGEWSILYSQTAPETTDALPDFKGAYVTDAVPGYWEDMYDSMSDAPFFKDLQINPDYKYLEYPLDLPSIPDMSLETVVGTFWYNRELDLPEDLENKTVYFKCVGVQNRAIVWINGRLVGEHRGYSAPFEFDITEFVNGGKNSVVLAVSNHQAYNEEGDPISGCTSRAANRFTGGIMGDITVDVLDRNHIRSAYVTPYDKETETFGVVADVVAHGDYTIRWQVFNGGLNYVSCGSSKTPEFRIPKIKKMNLWSPENPQIYELWLTVCAENKVCETYKLDFGIRSFECRDEKLFLNSTPVYLRGICEHGYFPMTVHPSNDVEYYKKVITKLKSIGFNFIRFHTWIPTEEYMIAADRLGMLLHVECPNNTTEAEWKNIMLFVRRHPSVVICCTGNEMFVGDAEVEKLRRFAEITHTVAKGISFSPMNAIRGVEYFYHYDSRDGVKVFDAKYKAERNGFPFEYHPERFKKLGEFCDLYSSYSQSHLSYNSLFGSPEAVDESQCLYNKPRISHETCILGTFLDITLEKRYEGTRIGKTELYRGPRRMLEELGLEKRAALYYRNSSLWQNLLRKQAFEKTRRAVTLSGYDCLGDIDHHWHTSGYRVGLMNEFYEFKPGITTEGVLQYNNASVLLSSIDKMRTFPENSDIEIDFAVSHYAGRDLENATLNVKLNSADNVVLEEFVFTVSAENGKNTDLARVKTSLPSVDRFTKVDITATLTEGDFSINNTWDIWVVPAVEELVPNAIVTDKLTDEILEKLNDGADVLMWGSEGFFANDVDFRVAFAGRSAGNLATVLEDHPITKDMDHDGYCSWPFIELMTAATSIFYPPESPVPFKPIVDVVTSYKWVRRTSALSEFKVGNGRLLISTFNTSGDSLMQRYWRNKIIAYVNSDSFKPEVEITLDELKTLFSYGQKMTVSANTNLALNSNDITMKKK